MKKKDNKDNREYYEYTVFEYKKGARFVEILIAILALIVIMLWISWPIFPAWFLLGVLKANGAGFWVYVVLLVGGLLVWFLNMSLLFNIIDSRRINIIGGIYDPFEKERYYFNIPKAHERVNIVHVEDGKMLDEWYHNGAFMIIKKDIDDTYLSYIYNILNDNYDLHNENLTLYKISKELFLGHYPYYKIGADDMLIFPASLIGITPEEHAAMRLEADQDGKRTMVLGFEDFSEKVEGVSLYRRKSYAYKDEVKKFYRE